MTVDDDTRATAGTPIPPPRSADPVDAEQWVEAWGSARSARPCTEYWDLHTAGWRSRGPVVPPGD